VDRAGGLSIEVTGYAVDILAELERAGLVE
jgi:hypothetical protein